MAEWNIMFIVITARKLWNDSYGGHHKKIITGIGTSYAGTKKLNRCRIRLIFEQVPDPDPAREMPRIGAWGLRDRSRDPDIKKKT
jgi:hypothetical protein